MVNRLISIDTSKPAGSQLPQAVLDEYTAIPLIDRVLIDPKIDAIFDENDKQIIQAAAVTDAVNWLVFGNAVTGGAPSIGVDGTDTAVGLNLAAHGAKLVTLNGVAPLQGFTTTATATATTTLTVDSTPVQVFTGIHGQTCKLPTTGVIAGQPYLIVDRSTGEVAVVSSASEAVVSLASGTACLAIALVNTPTTAAHWWCYYLAANVASGKKLSASNSLTVAALAESKTFTFANDTADVACLQAWQTLLHTRVVPRIGTVASSSTPTADANLHDQYNVTALGVAATFGAPTGVATDGQKLIYRIKDDGSARALSWNAVFRALGTTLPTTTVATKTLYVGTLYNDASDTWDVVSTRQQA